MNFEYQTDARQSCNAFTTVNVRQWLLLLEQKYHCHMTAVSGGHMMRVLGLNGRRLTVFLYQSRRLLMVQGHEDVVRHFTAHDANVLAAAAALVIDLVATHSRP